MSILTIQGLSKSYGKLKALDNLSISLEKGNVYGLLGPNGSGKTTTLAIITDVIRADNGTYEWFGGMPSAQARKKIGTILETPNFYPYLNAVDNLRIVQQIKGSHDDDIDELLQWVKLYERRKSKFRTYSLGMKQRLAIAASLIGDPEVLIFDEPTNGLDPQGIAEIRNIILRIAGLGKTIFFASHILDEVEKICTHVAILKNGRLLAEGSVGAIIDEKAMIEVSLPAENQQPFMEWCENSDAVESIRRENGMFQLSVQEGINAGDINRQCFENGWVLTHLRERKLSLEEEFLSLTK